MLMAVARHPHGVIHSTLYSLQFWDVTSSPAGDLQSFNEPLKKKKEREHNKGAHVPESEELLLSSLCLANPTSSGRAGTGCNRQQLHRCFLVVLRHQHPKRPLRQGLAAKDTIEVISPQLAYVYQHNAALMWIFCRWHSQSRCEVHPR